MAVLFGLVPPVVFVNITRLEFDANIGFHSAMVPADLEKAGPSIAAAAQAYG